MITNITDRERAQAILIIALKDARHEMSKRIEALEVENASLRDAMADAISTLDDWGAYVQPYYLSKHGFDADMRRLQSLAAPKPILDQLAEIGASDPQAWDKP